MKTNLLLLAIIVFVIAAAHAVRHAIDARRERDRIARICLEADSSIPQGGW
jgi:hypothetical protein